MASSTASELDSLRDKVDEVVERVVAVGEEIRDVLIGEIQPALGELDVLSAKLCALKEAS